MTSFQADSHEAPRQTSRQTDRCKVCHHEFFQRVLLRCGNMPGVAQFLPDEASLESDQGIDLELCQCSGCGLVQLSNEPVPYYRDVIRAAAFSEEMKEFRRKQFARFIERFSLGRKKVVEIGCGRGEFLALLEPFDLEVYGLEHLDESVMEGARRGLRIQQGFVESGTYVIREAPFDAFLMLNFLEHLPDPNSTLRGIYNNLAEDAVGLVEVPNFDMILRKNLFSEFTSDHLSYFTEESLGTALSLNGFEILECREEWYEYILSATVRKRKQLDLSQFSDYRARLQKEIEDFLQAFGPGRVAVWGAGHQALAVLSLANLAGKIKYVVDSATFKQGRFTPATHVPIVSPDMLDTDPVDAVIVMAASYSDEVAAIIRRKHGDGIRVSILRDFGLEVVSDDAA